MFGGGATGRLQPGSIEYSIANQSTVNTFWRRRAAFGL